MTVIYKIRSKKHETRGDVQIATIHLARLRWTTIRSLNFYLRPSARRRWESEGSTSEGELVNDMIFWKHSMQFDVINIGHLSFSILYFSVAFFDDLGRAYLLTVITVPTWYFSVLKSSMVYLQFASWKV